MTSAPPSEAPGDQVIDRRQLHALEWAPDFSSCWPLYIVRHTDGRDELVRGEMLPLEIKSGMERKLLVRVAGLQELARIFAISARRLLAEALQEQPKGGS